MTCAPDGTLTFAPTALDDAVADDDGAALDRRLRDRKDLRVGDREHAARCRRRDAATLDRPCRGVGPAAAVVGAAFAWPRSGASTPHPSLGPPRAAVVARRRRFPSSSGRGARLRSALTSASFSFASSVEPLLIVLPVVVLLPVDVHAIDDGVGAERMMVPDDDVGVLADFERADAIVDAQLLRRVDRDERERLVFGQAAPLDRLRRLGVQVPRQLRVVGVDRGERRLCASSARRCRGWRRSPRSCSPTSRRRSTRRRRARRSPSRPCSPRARAAASRS